MADEDARTGRSAAWGVAAGMFGAGAIYVSRLTTTSNSPLPIWPTYVLGSVAVLSLYLCFATIWGWRPTAGSHIARKDAAGKNRGDMRRASKKGAPDAWGLRGRGETYRLMGRHD